MGCWNATCQVSQMPIHAGEEVRFLLLVKSPFRMDTEKGSDHLYMKEGQKEEDFGWQPNACAGREGVYADNFWTPEFVPVKAKYNDYGSVECVDTDSLNWSIWMHVINDRIIELKQGSNEYHDPAVSKNMNLDQLLEVLQEGRLLFHYPWKGYRVPVSQTMIREDVYQAMLKLKVEDQWWSRGRDYNRDTIFEDGLKYFSKEKLDEVKNYWGFYSRPEVVASFKEAGKKLNIDMKRPKLPFYLMGDENMDSFFTFRSGEGGGSGLREYRDWIIDQLMSDKMTLDSERFKGLIREISDFIFIRSLFSDLRKTWHPGTGCGSQSSNLKMSAAFHSSIATLSENLDKSRHEDDDEYLDEEEDEEETENSTQI